MFRRTATVAAATCAALALAALCSADQPNKENRPVPAVLDFKMNSLAGKEVDLSRFRGHVVLIVNTASQCGFTPQYQGLEALNEKYRDRGLQILGFPADNFGHQEPGTNAEIGEFCQKNYGVKFDMFEKISVKGSDQAPLYRFLTEEKTDGKLAGEVKWNFEKFLVGRDGKVVARFRSQVEPGSPEVVAAIEAELAKPAA